MSDKRLRELQRRVVSGDLEAAPALYVERERAWGPRVYNGRHRDIARELFTSDCKCGFGGCINEGFGVEYNDNKFVPSKRVGAQYQHRGVYLSWKDAHKESFFHLRLSAAANCITPLLEETIDDKGYVYWVWDREKRNFCLIDKGPPFVILETHQLTDNPVDWPAIVAAATRWIEENLPALSRMQDACARHQVCRSWHDLEEFQKKLTEAKVQLANALLVESE